MIEFPITLNEHGDVTLFWSVADLESTLEAIDVKNNEYEASDAANRPLLLTVVEQFRPAFFGLFKVRSSVVKVLEK